MSAFICTTETIAVVAHWAAPQASLVEKLAVAALLIAQNKRSVDARYGEGDPKADLPSADTMRDASEVVACRAVGAIRCWIYQSCGTTQWVGPGYMLAKSALERAQLAANSETGSGWDVMPSELSRVTK